MSTAHVREKLYDYIRVADDKKLQAIYTILQDEITEETEWWKNIVFVSELEKDYQAWEKGEQKAYSFDDIKNDIERRRKKRAAK